jgi:hypothetical protein
MRSMTCVRGRGVVGAGLSMMNWLVDVARGALHVQAAMKRAAVLCLTAAILVSASSGRAQFVPAFLQNASYWRDGKSEVDFYNVDFLRDGQHFQVEVLMILTAELVDPKSFLRLESSSKPPDALPVIRMTQSAVVPRGLLIEERWLDALWRMDSMSLARLWFTGSDGIGHISRAIAEIRAASGVSWTFSSDTYRIQTNKPAIPSPEGTTVLYDEIPLRVRTMDFTKPTANFQLQLGRTITSPQEPEFLFKPATLSYQVNERAIAVELQHEGGSDKLLLDRDFPFLLREWKAADGTQWKLKNSLKAPFSNYNKPGDRERALKDPMLRHPD